MEGNLWTERLDTDAITSHDTANFTTIFDACPVQSN
ncbi:hypothetical protein TSMEX_006908 [Taenia solium]|eukprot:TsM_000146800 transcript=TsM_000146800 gene=TsM_000146800